MRRVGTPNQGIRKGNMLTTISGRPSIFSGKKKSDAAVIISINTSQSQTSFFSGGEKGLPSSGKQSLIARPINLG